MQIRECWVEWDLKRLIVRSLSCETVLLFWFWQCCQSLNIQEEWLRTGSRYVLDMSADAYDVWVGHVCTLFVQKEYVWEQCCTGVGLKGQRFTTPNKLSFAQMFAEPNQPKTNIFTIDSNEWMNSISDGVFTPFTQSLPASKAQHSTAQHSISRFLSYFCHTKQLFGRQKALMWRMCSHCVQVSYVSRK